MEVTEQNKCHPCNGKGKHIERICPEEVGAWFKCSCCNGTGVNPEYKEIKVGTFNDAKEKYEVAKRVAARRNFDKWSTAKLKDAKADLLLAHSALGNLTIS